MSVRSADRRSDWARRYPPLVGGLVAAILAATVLPSSLNVPQTNPQQTLEFAPVPPSDEDAPPPPGGGDLGSLSLGTSAGLEAVDAGPGGGPAADAPGDAPPTFAPGMPPPAPPGAGSRPTTKRCVGNPPRQTEDPMAPPCVAFFEGDNGGATYQGVTDKEVRVLLYADYRLDVGSRGQIERPPGALFDLARPATDPQSEPYPVQAARLYQRYFNERYQTYGRFVHMFVSISSHSGGGTPTPEPIRADAADDFAEVDPFAVVVLDDTYQLGQVYADAMAQRGVLSFGGFSSRSAELFRNYPGLQWDYEPSIEQHAAQFADFVCSRVVDKPVVDSGDPGENGQPRKLGLIRVDREQSPSSDRFAVEVREAVRACGGRFVEEVVQPVNPGLLVGPYRPDPAYGTKAMTRFQNAGVTTVIWAEGWEKEYSAAAKSLGYFPEWIIAGDRVSDDIVPAKYQDPDVWSHAWVVTNEVLEGPRRSEPCAEALLAVDPNFASADLAIPCRFYRDLRQLFTGIQVAGPRLSPDSLDEGFHAIPDKPSQGPGQPSCFYEPGDYTCVKDSQLMWWDPDAASPYSSRGCWRAVGGGQRHLPGRWAKGNLGARRDGDPCNAYTSGVFADPAPGPQSPPPQ